MITLIVDFSLSKWIEENSEVNQYISKLQEDAGIRALLQTTQCVLTQTGWTSGRLSTNKSRRLL